MEINEATKLLKEHLTYYIHPDWLAYVNNMEGKIYVHLDNTECPIYIDVWAGYEVRYIDNKGIGEI